MSTLTRLTAFAGLLAVVFAAAALAGSASGVRRGAPEKQVAMHGAMADKADPVRGLAVSDHGLTLQLARTTARPGEQADLGFRIADRRGRTVRDFDVEHTKRISTGGTPRTLAGSDPLRFTVTRDGRPVTVEPYLGAQGHLVALREGDLAFLHVHPDADSLRFMAEFPSAGRYRVFLQFKVGGRVHTAAFTKEVAS